MNFVLEAGPTKAGIGDVRHAVRELCQLKEIVVLPGLCHPRIVNRDQFIGWTVLDATGELVAILVRQAAASMHAVERALLGIRTQVIKRKCPL